MTSKIPTRVEAAQAALAAMTDVPEDVADAIGRAAEGADVLTPHKRRAVIYCRISKDRSKSRSKDQVVKRGGAGLGVARQETECRELAGRLNVEVVAVFSDNDLTAYKRSGKYNKPRPGYLAMLDYLKAGRAECVIAWHTDRLHRDNTELEGYISVCGVDDGIPTYTVRDGDLDLTTSGGRLVARIKGAVAVAELEHMIERQEDTKQANRVLGAWGGGPRPFGFEPDGPSLKEGGDGALKHVPAEAEAISKAFSTVLRLARGRAPRQDGEACPDSGIHTIAREWNEAGLRTPAQASRGGGNNWQPTTVRQVLLRATNIGYMVYGGKKYKGNWPPIVSEETWRAVVDILAGKDRKTSPGPKPAWLLSHVLICGVCDGMQFAVRTPKVKDTLKTKDKRARSPAYTCTAKQYATKAELEELGIKRYHLAREVERLEEYVEACVVDLLKQPSAGAAVSADPGQIDPVPALYARKEEINAELGRIAAGRFSVAQKEIMSAEYLEELDGTIAKLADAQRGTPLDEKNEDEDPVDYWYRLRAAGDMTRLRAIVAMLLRVRLLPIGKQGNPPGWRVGERKPFRYDKVEILPANAPEGWKPPRLGPPPKFAETSRVTFARYLAEHPWSSAREIAEAEKRSHSFTCTMLKSMRDAGEVVTASPPVCGGGSGNGPQPFRYALSGTAGLVTD